MDFKFYIRLFPIFQENVIGYLHGLVFNSTAFEILNLELFERLIRLLAVYMRVVSFLRAQI